MKANLSGFLVSIVTLSIRSNIVMLAGLCLLAVIVSVLVVNVRQAIDSNRVVGSTEDALLSIGQSISRITEMNLQIGSAAEEQSAVAEEVNRNVAAIRSVTETLTDQAISAATTAEQLDTLAEEQLRLVEHFKV